MQGEALGTARPHGLLDLADQRLPDALALGALAHHQHLEMRARRVA